MNVPDKSAKSPRVRWVRIIRLSIFAVVLILIAALVVPAWLYAYWFAHLGCSGTRDSLETLGYPSEAVSFPSRLGYTLRGWYSPGDRHPEIAIIVLTGIAGNTQYTLEDAATFAKAGYSTLVYEHRSCADPNLIHSGGYWESFDLQGAADYLKTRPDVQHIGVFGFSTGGDTALMAAGPDTDIEAVIAEGTFSSLGDVTLDPKQINTPLDWIARHLIVIFYEVNGVPVDKDAPVLYIGQISPRPLLLIFGELEADQGIQALYDTAGDPKDLWIVPGAVHGGYRAANPAEYERRLVGFFDTAFGVER